MGSRHRLRDELRWNGWPAEGFTLADNVADRAEHRAEFDARAYTVLDPACETCVSCVYLEPWDGGARLARWGELLPGLSRRPGFRCAGGPVLTPELVKRKTAVKTLLGTGVAFAVPGRIHPCGLVALGVACEGWHLAEPESGHDAQAAEWRENG